MTEPDQISDVQALRKMAAEFNKTPEGYALDLKLSFAEIVLRRLRRKRWVHGILGLKTELSEMDLIRIFNSDANCTFDTAGKILHALGVRATLQEKPDA